MGEPCIHYWLLGEATVIVSGVCKHCGERRDFKGDAWETNSDNMRSIIYNATKLATTRLGLKTVDGD